MKVLHTPEKKISVVYEGASQGFHKKLEKAALIEVMQTYNLTKEYLLYAGVWRDHKNVVGLIRAFDTLVRKYGYQGDLVITGRKDPKYHEVIETREDLGLQERVHFVGLVPDRDLIGLFQGATAFVFPTFYEGFGIPALEAFAMGTPLVCSNTSCLPEVCGNAAEYFDPYNQADMAKAIKRVVESPERQEELIAKGKEQLQKYSWDSMAKEIHSIYLSCLS